MLNSPLLNKVIKITRGMKAIGKNLSFKIQEKYVGGEHNHLKFILLNRQIDIPKLLLETFRQFSLYAFCMFY